MLGQDWMALINFLFLFFLKLPDTAADLAVNPLSVQNLQPTLPVRASVPRV